MSYMWEKYKGNLVTIVLTGVIFVIFFATRTVKVNYMLK